MGRKAAQRDVKWKMNKLKEKHILILYFLSWIVFAMTIKRYECIHCIYFNCPANSVEKELKEKYINKNR